MYSFRNGLSSAPRPSFIAAPRTQLGTGAYRRLDPPVCSREQPSPRRSHVQPATALATSMSGANWDTVFRSQAMVNGDQVWLAADDVGERPRVPAIVRSCWTRMTVVPMKLASQGVFQHTLPQTRARQTPEKEGTPLRRTPNNHHRSLERTFPAPMPAIIPLPRQADSRLVHAAVSAPTAVGLPCTRQSFSFLEGLR